MSEYLKLFKNHSEYETIEEKPIYGHCIEEIELHYNYPISQIERWIEDGTMCEEYDLYTKEKKQISYDSGVTWEDTSETRKGNLIEIDSIECGYEPSNCNRITYTSNSKLQETTSTKNGGLHTNAFNTSIVSHAFENGIGTIEFADCVTNIGNYAFFSASTITSINIPNSVTSIGYNTFYYCINITSIDIPNSVTNINGFAFAHCHRLTNINIPRSVTSIGDDAFGYCSGLTSCTIGSGVTSIGGSAFKNCTSLTSITVEATTPPTLGDYAFYNTNNFPIYVPSASVNVYKTATNWSTYASRIQAIP